ncbi:MAG: hypothetical protein ACFCUU_13645 [Cyclobacteriaceae bacterium]
MKQKQLFKTTINVGCAFLLAITIFSCNKEDSPEPNNQGEKYIQRIDIYTTGSTSLSTVFLYNEQKQITQRISSSPNLNTTTATFNYVGNKVSDIEIAVDGYKEIKTIDYDGGEYISVIESSYNNGNPNKSVFYRYDVEDNAYRIREGSFETYVYLNEVGDPISSDLSLGTYEYDNTKKGPLYSFRDNFNFNSIKSVVLSGGPYVHPVTTFEYYFDDRTTTYQNKYDAEGYLIESEGTTISSSYFKIEYTYTSL